MKTKEQIQAYNKDYSARPEVIAWAKVRNARPERRAVRRAYKKSKRGKEAEKRYRQSQKFKQRSSLERLKHRYNLTPTDYQLLKDKQNGLCAICKNPPKVGTRLVVDHSHKTNQVRGLLCGPCNMALGLLKDNIDFLGRAIDYLT